jgi:pSer/pThr/pTyr-binding forkhead associated (FHA) protein
MADTNAIGLGELAKRETVPRAALNWSVDSGRVVLVLTTGDQAPQLVDFGTHPYLTVGRAEPADVCVSDPGVSRLHVRFSRESGGVRVIDLGSRNGTWVRGMRITEALLAAGDSVVIGNTSVQIQAANQNGLSASLDEAALAELGVGTGAAQQAFNQGVNLRESLREHEAKLIREALRSAHGNQRRAAALLELPLRTFERKLRNMNMRQQAIARVTM